MLSDQSSTTAKVTTWLFVESDTASVERLSELIGLQCDTSRQKGEALEGRPGIRSNTNLWRLDSRREVADEPHEILRQITSGLQDILGRVSGHEAGFKAAGALGRSGLLVGVLAKAAPPIILETGILKTIADLNVDLEIDLILE